MTVQFFVRCRQGRQGGWGCAHTKPDFVGEREKKPTFTRLQRTVTCALHRSIVLHLHPEKQTTSRATPSCLAKCFECLGDFFLVFPRYYKAYWRHSLSTFLITFSVIFFLFTRCLDDEEKKIKARGFLKVRRRKNSNPGRACNFPQLHAWSNSNPSPPTAQPCKLNFITSDCRCRARVGWQSEAYARALHMHGLIMCTDLLNFCHPQRPAAHPNSNPLSTSPSHWKSKIKCCHISLALQCNKHNTERYDSRQHN